MSGPSPVTRARLCPRILLTILLGVATGEARAQEMHYEPRAGQGRIQVAGGVRYLTNSAFLSEARALGYDVGPHSYGLAPIGMATFAYWVEEHLEFSLEGTFSWDQYGPTLQVQSTTLGGTLRFAPLTTSPIWPYVGGNFGYSLNAVRAPLAYPLNSFNAEGYGGSIMLGTGIDLTHNFGVSFELRYTITSIEIPPYFHNYLNAGGLSFLIGGYLRIPKPHETMEPQIPTSLDESVAPAPPPP
jgi:hypothetical protein